MGIGCDHARLFVYCLRGQCERCRGTEGGERTDRHGKQVLRSEPWWGRSCIGEEGDNEGRGKEEEKALKCVRLPWTSEG